MRHCPPGTEARKVTCLRVLSMSHIELYSALTRQAPHVKNVGHNILDAQTSDGVQYET